MRPPLGRNLTHGLLDRLGRAIVIGQYESQPFPTEAELARQHGVSRSVTREAVKMLTAKGLLSARPRQGTIIEPTVSWNLFDTDVLRWLLERQLSADLLVQLDQLRVAIEPEAAALAARFATGADIEAIDESLARIDAAGKGLDGALEADIAFHVAILRGSGNPFYLQFRDMVGIALRTAGPPTGCAADPADRGRVLAAIKARDPEASRAAMRALVDAHRPGPRGD
ncbi:MULTISPECIES: FadR/GntR family transcriptional regulator [unclassified Sphingomonas]|jgi:DNA-binding FadR family transcriptional regulator|uniref:FadR/GntR family transcriptional regulator n=1 Tax=unclassified Sphingomonas TaxID=196159 RepID=UPI000AD36701|nr:MULTISPECIES: FadR/GntR family transcriptional regulator [unclassified Sphingomonas]